jgi:DnaJ family protein C protein 9
VHSLARLTAGSEEELEDLRVAYKDAKGDLEGIMASIPHSTHEDEARLVAAVEAEIAAGRLKRTKAWSSSSADKSAAKKRKRAAVAEAAEAEEEAKRLGVWDEFYGSGAKGKRARDEEQKGKGKKKGEEEDEGALAALIRGRQNSRAANFAALEAKYAAKEKKGKGKKKAAAEPHPDELDDDAFAALQAKMFGGKGAGKKAKADPHPDDLDDDEFAALQAKMLANKDKSKKRKTK